MNEIPAVTAALIRLIAEVFMTDTVGLNSESTAADVPGWDSVSQVMLIMQVEDEFHITLESDDVNEANNIGELAMLIATRQSAMQGDAEAPKT